ncbi:MAG: Type 1 glutamine amidotransferase-like domain-containing protein [Bacteroidota bacterium]
MSENEILSFLLQIGNKAEKLVELTPGKTIGYVSNALDFSYADQASKQRHIASDMKSLEYLDLKLTLLDLTPYFHEKDLLKAKLKELGAIFISGGNVFVLRQAMKLSGLDEIIAQEELRDNFLYSGYSAAGCVLSPSLSVYQIVDDANETPYAEWNEIIWEGLGLLDYAFMPHWDSAHHESADMAKEIVLCQKKGIAYKAIRDGEVIIIE